MGTVMEEKPLHVIVVGAGELIEQLHCTSHTHTDNITGLGGLAIAHGLRKVC